MSTTAETEVYENPNKKATETTNKPSKLWYLLPIFLGIIGGIVGYVVIKDEDRKMAKRLLIVGVIITLLPTVLLFVGVMFYFGMFAPTSLLAPTARGFVTIGVLEPWSLSASDGKITLNVQNNAGRQVSINQLTIDVGKGSVACILTSSVTIDSGNKEVVSCTPTEGWTAQKSNQAYTAKVTIGYIYNGVAHTDMGTISGIYA